MSVEGQVLGVSTVAGGGAAAVSSLANTGNPITVGVITAAVLIVIAAFATRFANSKR
jgi:hypothetical protein